MLSDSCEHVTQVGFRVQAVQPRCSNQTIKDGCAASTRVRAGKQVIAAAYSDSPDILPMSDRNQKFTILGIRFTAEKFVIEIANNAAQAVLSTWRTALAWSRWSPHGCWIQ
jgi:hypothetical protein